MVPLTVNTRKNQNAKIKKNSASVGKADIIFSEMVGGILLYYSLIALDVYLLLPAAYHPGWLAYLLSPNLKMIILAQLAFVLALG